MNGSDCLADTWREKEVNCHSYSFRGDIFFVVVVSLSHKEVISGGHVKVLSQPRVS